MPTSEGMPRRLRTAAAAVLAVTLLAVLSTPPALAARIGVRRGLAAQARSFFLCLER
jgi:hypothetical protein